MTEKTSKPWGYVSMKAPQYQAKPAPADVPKLVERKCAGGCGRKFKTLPHWRFTCLECKGVTGFNGNGPANTAS